jgi:PleD family two-component response regulator
MIFTTQAREMLRNALPFCNGEPSPVAANPEKADQMSRPSRVLIVEDEPILAENLKEYLNRCAIGVRTAADGKRVIQMPDSFMPAAPGSNC